MLKGKNILLGICGSIAAYKAAFLVRLLVQQEANVQVVMTPDAKNFISPLTLSTLSGKPVLSTYFDKETGSWNEHVQLALWADLLLIAPASANTLAKFANGLCDNLLTAVYLSARCPIYLSPAMDLDMWVHPATQRNLSFLQSIGNMVIQPTEGFLASGLQGKGRMEEPEVIVQVLQDAFVDPQKPLLGNRVLITAGPTYEPIDPVRFIGNHSSGKMGYALAEECARLGAEVILVSGPSALSDPKGVQTLRVNTAKQMLEECLSRFPQCQVAILSAAVADYRPKQVAKEKIKKHDSTLHIELEKTTDILSTLGSQKQSGQLLVGFALETENELENARDKLIRKNLDFIVLNSLREEGAGFAGDTNKVTFLDKWNTEERFSLKSKSAVAKDICQKVVKMLEEGSLTQD